MSALGKQGQRVVIDTFGETPLDAVAKHLRLEAQSPPDPASLESDDVVIAVRSAAVGWVDLLMSSGQYQHMAAPPYTPGLEYSGEVLWAGPKATEHVSVGDRVMADGLLTGPRSLGPHAKWGGFASYAVAPVQAVRPLPAHWSFDQGACLLGNYETAYHCLIARGGLQAGETVLIHGASGSTGLAAVHIARIMGATVIATGRSPEKLAIVAEQGAHHTICTTTNVPDASPRFREEVKALTDGRGVDMVYDGVGGPTSAESLRCVRFGARFLIVGWASTPFVAKGRGQRGAPNANVLPTNLIMMKGLDVLGCPTAISTHRDPSIRARRLATIDGWIAGKRLNPFVQTSFSLSDIREAMEHKWRSRSVGGCVVRPGALDE
ncbi:MAG: NADPH2:quinone reductase [Myxococcota bacterium]|jgi:NADPH2:quinone reductase